MRFFSRNNTVLSFLFISFLNSRCRYDKPKRSNHAENPHGEAEKTCVVETWQTTCAEKKHTESLCRWGKAARDDNQQHAPGRTRFNRLKGLAILSCKAVLELLHDLGCLWKITSRGVRGSLFCLPARVLRMNCRPKNAVAKREMQYSQYWECVF